MFAHVCPSSVVRKARAGSLGSNRPAGFGPTITHIVVEGRHAIELTAPEMPPGPPNGCHVCPMSLEVASSGPTPMQVDAMHVTLVSGGKTPIASCQVTPPSDVITSEFGASSAVQPPATQFVVLRHDTDESGPCAY